MFSTILVPVDGSPFSEHALPVALGIAQKNQTVVHIDLVHVPATYSDLGSAHLEDEDRAVRHQEQHYLDDLRQRLAAGRTQCQIHHLEGLVAETLEAEVAKRGIRLVVMSTHGWGYVSRAILGSVADRLIRHLTSPFLLIHPPQEEADLGSPVSYKRILVPLDGSALAESVLEPARALGGLFQAEFHLLRVVAPPHHLLGALTRKTSAADQRLLEQRKQEAAGYLEKAAEEFRKRSLAVQTHIAVGSPAATILEQAGTLSCDLIAIATHGAGGLRRLLFGSVTDKVLRSSTIPMFVKHVAH